MPEPKTLSRPIKRRRWPRRLTFAGGGLVVFLVLACFVATSSAFIKGVILPRVGRAMNAEISVADISLSPFSQVALRRLAVKTTGSEPLVQAEEVRVRYSLWSILGGNIKVDEVTLQSPVIQIVENADGTSNLDPLLKEDETKAAEPSRPSAPLQLALKNFALKNATARVIRNLKDGGREVAEISNLNVTLDQLMNGQSGKLNLAADMQLSQNANKDSLQAKGSGALDFALGADLMPLSIKGKVTHEIVKAEGAFRDLNGNRTVLDCDVTSAEIKGLSISFLRADRLLGALRIRGPFDLAKREGQLQAEVQSIDRHVLNLVGAARGWDFGNSTINATNLIELSQQGTILSASGQLTGRQLGITAEKQTTPPIDLNFDYQVNVDLNDQSALVQKLNLSGRQGQSEILRAALDRPMNLTWGGKQPGFKESTLDLTVNQLNLADWRAFAGEPAPSGKLDVQLKLLAQQDGKRIQADLNAAIRELSARFSSNRIDRIDTRLQLTARIDNFESVHLDKYTFELGQPNRPLLSAGGSATRLATGDLSLQTALDVALPGLLQQISVPELAATAGAVKFTGLFSQKGRQLNASGNLVLSDFSGRYGGWQLQNFQTTFDFDVEMKERIAQIRRLALATRQGPASGGSLDLAGKYDLAKDAGEFTFNAVDLNQNTLGTFLAPALAPNKLVSVSLNGKGSASYDPRGESAIKAAFKLANLVVQDPQNKLPGSPLSAELQIDGGLRQQLLTLRQFVVKLSPTERAKNELQLAGKVDLAKANATPSEITLRAESLDVTPYYDLFAAKSEPATKEPAKQAPARKPSPSQPPTEPEPVALSIQQLTFDAKVDRLFLREIAVSNFVANAKVSAGRVMLTPLELSLNGAPVSANADLNLGVKGWTYDVSASLDKVPLEPIADSFSPGTRGQYQGLILANMQVKGAGVTGKSLQKSLGGRFSYAYTNANIQLVGRKTRLLLFPIATLLRVEDIMKSPLNWLHAQGELGNARIKLSRFSVQSEAFEAHTQGEIPIADVLMQSPVNLPVEFSLRRSLAQKSGLMPLNAPPDAPYVALPRFVTVKGTLAEPKSDLNELALGGLLLKSGVGIAEKLGVDVGDKAGGILKGVGNLLTGQGQTTNTNKPSGTNPPPKLNPLDFFKKK